jgi:peptide-methionine (S)-S-oxide reductase
VKTIVGYTGGTFQNPTYRDVCGGRTGHAEAVQVSYEPDKVSLEQILHKFWELNAPTFPEPVRGQYRSAVFFYTKEQEAIARKELAKLEASRKRKIYTEITPASEFYKAEEYHQNYEKKHGFAGCRIF